MSPMAANEARLKGLMIAGFADCSAAHKTLLLRTDHRESDWRVGRAVAEAEGLVRKLGGLSVAEAAQRAACRYRR